MNKNKVSYIIIIFLLLGLMSGMARYDLIVPALGDKLNPYYHGTRGKNRVSLTFNVDWGEDYIPGILKVLAAENVKATFFVTGNWAAKFPRLLKEINSQGHEIGNHGYSHKNPVKLNNSQLQEHIKKNEKLIYTITGQITNLYAPPYGDVNQKITEIATDMGYRTIMWSADSIDWQKPAPEIIIQRVINKVDDGGIILLHPTRPTLKALPEIIDKLRNRGFQAVVVSQLIQKR